MHVGIDIVLVVFGQVQAMEFGIDRGICLKTPRCDFCQINSFCKYFRDQNSLETQT